MSYIHGSNLILGIMVSTTFTPFGHSSGCKISSSAETSEHATKESSAGKWVDKSVKKLSVSLSAEGFRFEGDDMNFPELWTLWKAGEPVTCRYCIRDSSTGVGSTTTYYSGNFIITSLEENASADDDATYSVSLESCGEITFTSPS